jgi:calcineurin-like phosphoesterase family protein
MVDVGVDAWNLRPVTQGRVQDVLFADSGPDERG